MKSTKLFLRGLSGQEIWLSRICHWCGGSKHFILTMLLMCSWIGNTWSEPGPNGTLQWIHCRAALKVSAGKKMLIKFPSRCVCVFCRRIDAFILKHGLFAGLYRDYGFCIIEFAAILVTASSRKSSTRWEDGEVGWLTVRLFGVRQVCVQTVTSSLTSRELKHAAWPCSASFSSSVKWA